MGTKTIAVSDETYELLRSLKRRDESFNDAIGRLAAMRASRLSSYFGKLRDSKSMTTVAEDSSEIRNWARVRL